MNPSASVVPPSVPLLAAVTAAALLLPITTGGSPAPALAPAAAASARADRRVPVFTYVVDASRITFGHHFIDSESGSGYQINPHDLGSGVCSAGVDDDGQDDLYCLDFLGSAKLYRNLGGMKFEDVTAKAGVAIDRA